MSNSHHSPTVDEQYREDDHSLSRFERNRFFNGKLMTARDMRAEQWYHAERLETVTGQAIGWGIVCGLGAWINPAGDGGPRPRAVVESGIAIDKAGQIVVVPEEDSQPFPEAIDSTNQEVSVYLRHDTCLTESVPAHGSEDACKEECDYNRTVETYEIIIEEGGPSEQKPLPFERVRFPTAAEVQEGETTESGRIANTNDAAHLPARSYHGAVDNDVQLRGLPSCETPEPGKIFLGHFESDDDGAWQVVEDRDDADATEPRSYVYTNDMVYTGLVDHATDFGNPHELSLSVEAVETGAGIGIDGPEVTVAGSDGTTVGVDGTTITISGGTGAEELGPLVDYFKQPKLRLDALRRLACVFEDLREQFEYVESNQDTDTDPPAVIADGIAVVTRQAIEDGGEHDAVHEEPEEFLSFVENQLRRRFKEFLKSLPEFVGGTNELESASLELDSVLRNAPDDEAIGANAVAIELRRFAETASCLSGRCIRFGQFAGYTPVTSPLTLKDIVVNPLLVELPQAWTYVPTVVPISEEDAVLEFPERNGLRVELPRTDRVDVEVRRTDYAEVSAYDDQDAEIGSESAQPGDDSATITVSRDVTEDQNPISYVDITSDGGYDATLVRDGILDNLSDEERERLGNPPTTAQLVSVCVR